ncbi:uncharacterized protein F4822DRAFT_441886 [Hypoxylon trugodes]|uniref:uncharacterized protein n=1 Tax=Hypoxylon trugodes TaxID=326681 RepID=UPI00219BC73D|nr:uncharacterized protein F4822DRAFT_441886 [Hypoxylon trugodes]KAI1390513.1 hypothetical protein F4822DRAFT_441886 [Hypoxylon trugodes]
MSTEERPSLACRNAPWSPETTIHYEGSDAFTNATKRWNAYGAPKFCAAVTPSNEEELANIVKVANAANIPFLATGGRHHYGTTLSKLQSGLAIDLSRLNQVKVDSDRSAVTVGGGAKIRDVLGPVTEAGYQIPSGACSGAGFIGSGIGGGIGYLQGVLGLVVDALVSVNVVTAQGELVQASENTNEDLFWALRGAGTNFGIITSAIYKLSKPVNNGQVFYADVVHPASMKSEYFKAVESFNDGMSPKLGFSSALFWDASTQETQILTTFIYAGPEEEARKELAPFFDLNPVIARLENIQSDRMPELIIMGITEASCNTTGGLHSIHPVCVRKLSAETYISVFDKLDTYYKTYEDVRASAVILEAFSNHAVAAVPDDATAYPWRDAKGHFMIQMRWTGLDNPFAKTANSFALELRGDIVATSGYPELSAYVSYAWGDETLKQKFGPHKLSRLLELKRKWDPDNIFRYCNPLLTE